VTDANEPVGALLERAVALLSEGRSEPALGLLAGAAAAHPGNAAVAARHADALHLAGRLAGAILEYRRALALDDGEAEAWYGLGCAELACKAYGEAARCLGAAVARSPARADMRFKLGEALFELGEVDPALGCFRAAASAGDPALRRLALANIAMMIPGSPAADNADILAARREWAALETAAIGPPPARRFPPATGRKLRIGYVSAFFGRRNWMKPVWGAINHHDRTAFEIHFFADSAGPSAQGGYRGHPADYVHEISGAPNEAVARFVAQAGIDILVDLNGYSYQSRLPLFMRRPAPLVAAWFGMYATTGIEAFDYTIADGAALPPEEERFCTERVLRVPPSYLAFRVFYPVPDVTAPPSLAGGFLTFGCLCSQYKITDEVIAAWAAILAGAPSSRLLLKNAALGDGSSRAALLARFARHGVAADRLRLDGPAEHAEFLATYDAIDVALDTFPYNGGTTTMEALWQGVPVLSFDGDRWASRTSRSLLVAARLDDWCLPDQGAYVARAVALANDPGTPRRLAALRAALRDRLAASPACDGAGLARSLESLYRDMAAAAALF
jgi:predicted O-linked N-acetylglucosamine transferase (SPINDLY family)